MNQKALRQEVELPPLLNLQEDRPHVASDFRSAEHNNAPYINGMLLPLWKKEYDFTNRPVYDYENNKYEIKNGWLTRNDKDLFPIDDRHFEREDVTEEFSNYLAYDFDNNGTIAKLEWNTGNNSVKFTYGNWVYESGGLFSNGVVLASRVRVIYNSNGQAMPIGILVYESNGWQAVFYMDYLHQQFHIQTINWYNTQPKTDPNATFSKYEVSMPSPSIMINISPLLTNSVGVSLVSNYGEVLFTRKEGFYSFLYYEGANAMYWGQNILPADGSSTEVIRNYIHTNFIFSQQNSSTPEYFNVYRRDNKWYYVNDPATEVPDSTDIAFNPKYIPNQTFEYEGQTYSVYQAVRYYNRILFKSFIDNDQGRTINATVHFSDGYTGTGTYAYNNMVIDHTYVYWTSITVRANNIDIDYGGAPYYVANPTKQFTITTEIAPSTVQAAHIVAPNVFLDNGNMYSFYTIPSASEVLSAQPMTLPNDCLIIESGKLTWFDASSQRYGFEVIESHITNPYCPFPRENSICVGQNFWNSSTKFASNGCRTPYDMYVAKTASETFDANVKFTEYSNSNTSDMLYYAGTCPKNEFKFFKYATNNSEDVAYFNPGGFRAELKGGTPWQILYYVDSTGAVAVQGISYAENGNKMGTLVTPIDSPAKVQYIAGCPNFVIYTDGHNKIYKVSIKSGAQISSIFDNKYIIVNTPSFWNIWDEQRGRKYHYATDYNNRVKEGLDRNSYRTNNNWFFTELKSRQYVTAINANYNVLPRLPVSSILPGAIALCHFIGSDHYPYNIRPYQSECDEAREVQAIDIFAQYEDATDASVKYVLSIKPYQTGPQIFRESNLEQTSYSDTKAILAVVDILSKFIDGAGNHSLVVEGTSKYVLNYNNQNKPTFLYSLVSGIDVDDVQWFFVLQGQYYAVIGEKLYAMIYSNGLISQSDAIVDIRDMKYVGNTPAIAFFVNPYTKQVYSFTGDANLQKIFDAGKYHFQWAHPEKELKHWYDESTQSIYIATDEGLLVFGPDNTYCLEDYKDVVDIEFVDGDIHIIENDKETTIRYYHDRDGYETAQTYIETSFWGLGANEITSIDRWQITLYDPEHREQDVFLQVRTLTDVSTQSEEKKLHINASDWDKYTHSALVSFTPKLIKAQGIRLSIKTIAGIQKIVPHVADQKTSTPTNSKFSI